MKARLLIQCITIWLTCFCFDISYTWGVGGGGTNGDGLAIGLGVGLGVGLPFICAKALNLVMLKAILKDLFGPTVELSKNVIQKNRFDNKETISCPDDLFCDFNNRSESQGVCHWENNKYDRPCLKDDLRPVYGQPTKMVKWKKLMGNNKLPDGGYFAFASGKSGYPVSVLSRVVPEQKGDGILQLKYWLSASVTLQVCLLLEDSNYKDLTKCSATVKNGKSHIAQFKIKGPITSRFKIMIQASNFVVEKGSMVIIDEIKYASDLCGSSDDLKECKPSECISIG